MCRFLLHDLVQILVWRYKTIMHHAINNSRRILFTTEKNPEIPTQFFQFLTVVAYNQAIIGTMNHVLIIP